MECQTCGEPLCIAGEESSRGKLVPELPISRIHTSPIHDIQSKLGNSEMDQSFVILENQRKESPDKMDGSFVVLPPTVASVCGCDTSLEKGFVHIPSSDASSSDGLHASNATFDSTANVFKHIFDIVSSQSQVQQPSCSECMKIMFEKIQREGEDIHRDIKAYEKCFETLKESPNVLSESDFLREKAKVEEEENKLEAQIKQIEKQRINVRNELQKWESQLEHLDVMEERYWQNINSYSLELINYQEEQDAILAKEEVTQMQLDYLKWTNVLNDAFRIHDDGDFGTINNLRLGVLPEKPVQWDERNAAWGQACHLLHSMAMHCGLKFSYP